MLELGTRIQHTTKLAIVRVQKGSSQDLHKFWPRIALCIVLACIGVSWFAYQLLLVAQSAEFAPDWQDAQWVQATNETTPVAYFRYTTDITILPDAAFVTVSANQMFRLYVNNTFIATNAPDIASGNGAKAYMYDVSSALVTGTNVVGIRVANIDQKLPALRATFGVVQGSTTTFHSTGNPGWQATANVANVYPRYDRISSDWTTPAFDASSWPSTRSIAPPLPPTYLTVNPQLYEHALSQKWMSVGSGHDAYFVRTLSVPDFETGSWLRVVATGPADIFINGKHVITWNGAPLAPQQQIVDYLSDDSGVVTQYRQGLVLGVYDITSYVHGGNNTLAIHVSSPGISSAQVGLEALSSSLNADVLTSDSQDHVTWLVPDGIWRVSDTATPGWQTNTGSSSWTAPSFVGRPGVSRTIYLPDTPSPRNVNVPSFTLLGLVFFLSIAFVVGLWLVVSRYIMRRYYNSLFEAMAVTGMAYLPAIALEGLLVSLGWEPLVAPPFPYTLLWAALLLLVIVIGYILLWMHARMGLQQGRAAAKVLQREALPAPTGLLDVRVHSARLLDNIIAWLKHHWGLALIILAAIALVSYEPMYQPYWQDELTSYFAAKGVLAHGLPFLPSGFLYAKAEFYSDLLALSMLIFGEQNGAPRILSMIEYVASLPIFYYMALSFFHNKKLALLATAMLAFSPSTLLWGYEMRMYEQAQFFAIIVVFMIYRALQQPDKPIRIYLAIGFLLLNYFSHEEIFIILPGLVVIALLLSWNSSRPLPEILYKKHWWIAAAIGAGIIGLQLWLSKSTHPPVLGTDQSQQPMIQIADQNLPYYLKLLFAPFSLVPAQPNYAIDSILSIIGGIWAIQRRDKPAILLFILFWSAILVLTFVFTLQSDRYVYPILPFMFLLAAYAVQRIFSGMWDLAKRFSATLRAATSRPPEQPVTVNGNPIDATRPLSLPIRIALTSTIALVLATMLFLPTIPISNYNHLVSDTAGWLYHKDYPDYDDAGQYVKAHWQNGDIVISVSPAISILYYVGRVDYFFSIDRALYLFDRGDGHITDTPTGSTPLLSGQDFQSVLTSHSRIWIITDNSSYQAHLSSTSRFLFPTDFRKVYEGYGSAVYLRGS